MRSLRVVNLGVNLCGDGVADEATEVAQRFVDDFGGVVATDLGVRLERDVELVALQVDCARQRRRGLREDPPTDRANTSTTAPSRRSTGVAVRRAAFTGTNGHQTRKRCSLPGGDEVDAQPLFMNPLTFSKVWPVQTT